MPSFSLNRILILLAVSYLFFFFGNNFLSLTDPDETFYALTAKEMLAKGEWFTPLIFAQPQFEKPILTFWLLKFAFQAGGITPFAARFFPALFATFGVLAVYFLGLLGFKEERKAFLSALVLGTSAFFVAMGKTVFTDMVFTVFILYAILSFVWAFVDRRRIAAGFIAFYVFGALATLTKGPLGLLIPELIVVLFLFYRRQISFIRSPWVLMGLFVYACLVLPWYVYMFKLHGQAFIHEFFYNDHWRRWIEAEHKGADRWFFYPASMVAGLFPWSLFLVAGIVAMYHRLKNQAHVMDHLVLSWVLVTFVIFQSAHSKLTSYILPLYPALAFMTGNFLDDQLLSLQKQKKMKLLLCMTLGIAMVLGVAVIALRGLYQQYVPSTGPIYFLSGALMALAGVGIVLVFKERLVGAIYAVSLFLLPMLFTVFMIGGNIEGHVSSFEASQYIPQKSATATTVLTGKMNARGIRYYTGQDVAVINSGGNPFFSPHPIPILDTQEKIRELLDRQHITYGVVKKSVYEDLSKNFAGYQAVLLKHVGPYYILRIEPSGAS